VKQRASVLWSAELGDHAPAATAGPRIDPDGIDPPLAPSGPQCSAELPHRLRVRIPWDGQDILFRYEEVSWNPPLPEGTFAQLPTGGLRAEDVDCP
jgi:hypothetical protein